MKVFTMDQHILLEVLGSLTFLRGQRKKVFFLGFNYVYQVVTCLFLHLPFMIYLLNQCFDLAVKPRGVLVITDYILIWNEIMKNVEHGLVEKLCLLIIIHIVK